MISNSKQRKLSGEWRHLGGGVYESKYNDRIHTGGLIMMAGGHQKIFMSNIKADLSIYEYIKVAGSRKRGMMLFTELAKPSEILAISRSR